ncbi:MAG: hypothetical protein KZQ65_11445, partial [Candidatus Thiodiazotropha sp. (ex Gloverina cf. vestifex)]|nr:hypothetical protein [Candidatus Thiodiazotropha sp. (ex Gloverina cf. vestifex)]
SGHNGCRVGESILGTRMSQNLSRGSDTLEDPELHFPVYSIFTITPPMQSTIDRGKNPAKMPVPACRTP